MAKRRVVVAEEGKGEMPERRDVVDEEEKGEE